MSTVKSPLTGLVLTVSSISILSRASGRLGKSKLQQLTQDRLQNKGPLNFTLLPEAS